MIACIEEEKKVKAYDGDTYLYFAALLDAQSLPRIELNKRAMKPKQNIEQLAVMLNRDRARPGLENPKLTINYDVLKVKKYLLLRTICAYRYALVHDIR